MDVNHLEASRETRPCPGVENEGGDMKGVHVLVHIRLSSASSDGLVVVDTFTRDPGLLVVSWFRACIMQLDEQSGITGYRQVQPHATKFTYGYTMNRET